MPSITAPWLYLGQSQIAQAGTVFALKGERMTTSVQNDDGDRVEAQFAALGEGSLDEGAGLGVGAHAWAYCASRWACRIGSV